MVESNFPTDVHLKKHMRKEEAFFESFAKDYLVYLGNPRPSSQQISEIKGLLSHVWLRRTLVLDKRLTPREQQCLYLSAQGKKIAEIALFLNISARQVERHRQAILQKLGSKNLAEAIAVGLRYGAINHSG